MPEALPPQPPSLPAPSATAPLSWAGGVALLGAAVWLPGMIGIFRAFASLFR